MPEVWAVVKETERTDLLEFVSEYAHRLKIQNLRFVARHIADSLDIELKEYGSWDEVE